MPERASATAQRNTIATRQCERGRKVSALALLTISASLTLAISFNLAPTVPGRDAPAADLSHQPAGYMRGGFPDAHMLVPFWLSRESHHEIILGEWFRVHLGVTTNGMDIEAPWLTTQVELGNEGLRFAVNGHLENPVEAIESTSESLANRDRRKMCETNVQRSLHSALGVALLRRPPLIPRFTFFCGLKGAPCLRDANASGTRHAARSSAENRAKPESGRGSVGRRPMSELTGRRKKHLQNPTGRMTLTVRFSSTPRAAI